MLVCISSLPLLSLLFFKVKTSHTKMTKPKVSYQLGLKVTSVEQIDFTGT